MSDPSTTTYPGSGRLITAPRVFFPAAILLIVFVAIAIFNGKALGDALGTANTYVVKQLGWYYVAVVSGFVFFAGWLALSPMGRIVLGKEDDEPEFSLGAWFGMLFAAGMGIGLVFYGAAEPLMHFASPPPGVGEDTVERAKSAMNITYLHWGLHAWAIYVVAGLALAYAVHRRGRPVSIRWALYPLLGDRVKGVLGDIIDVVAVVGTLFGVATSLGLGVKQVAGGFQYLGVIGEPSNAFLVMLIVAITGLAVISVTTGLDKGIKYLSNANMILAALFIGFILFAGSTFFIMNEFVQSVGSYFNNFFSLSFRTFAYQGEDGAGWLSGWTTYYWGWWMSWAPFVGVFIARISRGRTVREFILGVMLVPTLVTFLWFAVLGGSALQREMFGEGGLIAADGKVSSTNALFQLLDGLPAAKLLAIAAMVLIVVFFVTSSDSGSFVVDMLSSGGNPNPPIWSRVFWGVMEGTIAAALLVAGSGGLGALQMMAILSAAPFSIVMILMAVSVAKGLMEDRKRIRHAERRWLAEEIAKEIADDDNSAKAST